MSAFRALPILLGALLAWAAGARAAPDAKPAVHHRHHHAHHHPRAAARKLATAALSAPRRPAAKAVAAPGATLAVVPAPAPPAQAVAVAAPAPALWYDFKGARLGMSLAEWKAAPFPGGGVSQATAECSDAPATRLFISAGQKAMGVVECRYGAGGAPAPIPLGERFVTADYSFAFLDGRLFRITVRAALAARGDVDQGLADRWGKPTSEAADTTHTEAGGALARTVKTWANPAAAIVLETPGDRLDELCVTYADLAAAARADAGEKAPHAVASVM